MNPRNGHKILGIDLGTTFSSVGLFEGGQVSVLTNNYDKTSTPSIVAFKGNEKIVGESARLQSFQMLSNCVYDSKRLIGRTFENNTIPSNLGPWPFKVICEDGKPMYEVQYKNKTKHYSPEKISSFILKELKQIAEEYCSTTILDAVITVPADFDSNQREATRQAGKLAGLNVVRVVEEPVAAAIAYGLNKYEEHVKILIFDFGGGTLDVSLLDVCGNNFKVIATEGNSKLGGQDIDNNLMQHFAKIFADKYGYNPLDDPLHNSRAIIQLKSSCENAKIALSRSFNTSVNCPNFWQNHDLVCEDFTRADFEDINYDIFQKILEPVQKILQNKGLAKHEIDSVVLVGGSSKIPKIKEILNEYFGKNPLCNIDPFTAVVKGATIIANDISKSGHNIIRYESVIPHNIGLQIAGGKMDVLIPKNTKLPISIPISYTTKENDQPEAMIRVFMGDNEYTCYNSLLWQYLIEGINFEKPVIVVELDVSLDGILTVKIDSEDIGLSKSDTLGKVAPV
ncbi:hsp71-like protein [Histomonas meleagridis]|uniref:hsp71-like protein n=1 Tax=Histomonas meleagridis TaxID=135588 RepID=UPI00355A9C92|nr:hsp71-like protein [Histomonas meleagridis]KAH0802672.1 hsp71-like protein [Histomonas meleagridis]